MNRLKSNSVTREHDPSLLVLRTLFPHLAIVCIRENTHFYLKAFNVSVTLTFGSVVIGLTHFWKGGNKREDTKTVPLPVIKDEEVPSPPL